MNKDIHTGSRIEKHGFGLKGAVAPLLAENYKSDLVEQIRQNNFVWPLGRTTFHLAREFGFCYGVDKAIDFAYETRTKFPGRKIYITNEVIHNSFVNNKLMEMGIGFLNGQYKGDKGMEDIQKEDIVLLPAFGSTVQELEELKKKECLLVDTTCGSVIAVWKRVEKYTQDGFSAMIHGKHTHEETLATCSRADKYIVVWDKEEACKICDYIENGGDKEKFLRDFADKTSAGFDPDRDLQKVGCANQTTMMSRDSLEIANQVQASMVKRYGAANTDQHFRHFDTICSATQDRQDAIQNLLAQQKMDLVIVIGGYNSSNTTHLLEIGLHAKVPTYHVKDADCLISASEIEHKRLGEEALVKTRDWLPTGNIHVGVTAGASTPNRLIENVIHRIDQLANS